MGPRRGGNRDVANELLLLNYLIGETLNIYIHLDRFAIIIIKRRGKMFVALFVKAISGERKIIILMTQSSGNIGFLVLG